MGRKIRKVPLGWHHPQEDYWDTRRGRMDKRFVPLYDQSYSQSAKEWVEEFELWQKGEHPNQLDPDFTTEDCQYYWEYDCMPPSKMSYRPDWEEQEMNAFCLYETVSEGTPVSPVCATLDELAEYLAKNGDFWDQRRGHGGWGIERAKAFCQSGWAPSFVVVTNSEGTTITSGKLAN